MAAVYASLIIKGLRTIDSVPAIIKDEVKRKLIELGRPDLAQEEGE